MNEKPASRGRLFAPASFLERSRVAEVLRAETVGGLLLMLGAVTALVWANSPWSSAYEDLRDFTLGPHVLHLDLTLGEWAADGLLAIFFFVAGLELKREFVAGELRDPRRAALPVAAAVGGMVVPALIYVAVNAGHGTLRGWAIPTATDIAFAVAVLALISSHLPSGLRTFLLTLAVVDDLLAITVIALFYTDQLHIGYLALAAGAARDVRAGRPHPDALGATSCSRWRSRPGRSCMRRACTRRWPGCCSRSRSRYAARPTTAAGWPSISSTWSGRSQRGWRCRSSRSSPPA